MTIATITTKGQITIPKKIRDKLRLSAGDKIEFVMLDEGEAVIRPVSKRVDDVFGILHKTGQKTLTVEQINKKIRQKMKERF